jgi:hypothetical protein
MAQSGSLLPVMLATLILTGSVASTQRGPEKIPDYHLVFDIPHLAGITMDGQKDDWKDRGFLLLL